MRLALLIAVGAASIAACTSSTAVVAANSCGSSGASANIGATDGLVFSPSGATITHGQSVCWQNNGNVSHTVTSNDGTSFNASLTPGNIFVHAFPAAGTFQYHCTIHAGMTGTVTVN
ncbi:MAG TPA: plastocyanin/azurin family copper-binding protein [Gemmatimonadaceae bacterium]|jgi:plastocyanin|nr:plastocyanin/azurin family copper-binding protein [Gemmatimonadaceae bacterium]